MSNGNTARQILEQPFDQGIIKSRPASFGGSLSYVEAHEYIKRLNQAFDGNWSFEIVKHEIGEHEVIVVGKLVADGIIKMAFGGSDIKRKKETGEIICIADDLKAAATDALKKASSFLGLGLHLYGDGGNDTAPKNGNGQAKANGGNGNCKSNGNGNGNGGNGNGTHAGNGNDNGRLTSRQLNAIFAIGRERGISRDQIKAMTLERFGKNTEFLAKVEASSFIEELLSA